MAIDRTIRTDGVLGQTDYIERGSAEHAAMLGLRKWADGDTPELNVGGWTFEDVTQYGPMARLDYIKAALTQRVAELGKVQIEVRETTGKNITVVEKGKVIINAQPMFDPDRIVEERGSARR